MLSHYHILGAEDWGMRENNFYCFLVCHEMTMWWPQCVQTSNRLRKPSWNHLSAGLVFYWFGMSSLVVCLSWLTCANQRELDGKHASAFKISFCQRKNTDVKTSFLFKMKRVARGNRRVLVKFDNNLSYMYFWPHIIVFKSFLKTAV